MAWAIGVLGAACSTITGDLSQPVAIEFVTPPDTVRVNDTVFVGVRVLRRDGDSIPGAPVALISLNPDTLGIDSARQSVIGLRPGPARIVAVSASLRSDPLRIVVAAAPTGQAVRRPGGRRAWFF